MKLLLQNRPINYIDTSEIPGELSPINGVHTVERLDDSFGSHPVCVPTPLNNGDYVHFVMFCARKKIVKKLLIIIIY